MVSFKKLLSVGAILLGAVNAIPTYHPSGEFSLSRRSDVVERDYYPVEGAASSVTVVEETYPPDLAKRAGRMTLQWSPQGRIFFLLGASFPTAVLDSFYSLGEGGPAKALLQNFENWLDEHKQDYQRVFLLWIARGVNAMKKGGVYGKGAGALASDFGFALNTASFPAAEDLQALLSAISDWASQAGGVVQVIARPNGFFDPAVIGAGEMKRDIISGRSRGNTCPADTDLLQYATADVSIDIDINRDIRWAGECDA